MPKSSSSLLRCSILYCSMLTLGISGAATVSPWPASASASTAIDGTQVSCAQWNNIVDVRQVPIYSSILCAYMGGERLDQGTKIREEGWFNTLGYEFTARPSVCNYWLDFEIWDSSGNRYYKSQGDTVPGCSNLAGGEVGTRALQADYILKPSSELCLTLYHHTAGEIKQVVRTCGVIS